jgi:hypothetical protein
MALLSALTLARRSLKAERQDKVNGNKIGYPKVRALSVPLL